MNTARQEQPASETYPQARSTKFKMKRLNDSPGNEYRQLHFDSGGNRVYKLKCSTMSFQQLIAVKAMGLQQPMNQLLFNPGWADGWSGEKKLERILDKFRHSLHDE